MSKNK